MTACSLCFLVFGKLAFETSSAPQLFRAGRGVEPFIVICVDHRDHLNIIIAFRRAH